MHRRAGRRPYGPQPPPTETGSGRTSCRPCGVWAAGLTPSLSARPPGGTPVALSRSLAPRPTAILSRRRELTRLLGPRPRAGLSSAPSSAHRLPCHALAPSAHRLRCRGGPPASPSLLQNRRVAAPRRLRFSPDRPLPSCAHRSSLRIATAESGTWTCTRNVIPIPRPRRPAILHPVRVCPAVPPGADRPRCSHRRAGLRPCAPTTARPVNGGARRRNPKDTPAASLLGSLDAGSKTLVR